MIGSSPLRDIENVGNPVGVAQDNFEAIAQALDDLGTSITNVATGDGVTNDAPAIDLAADDASTLLLVPGTYRISTSISLPATCLLRFMRGAMFSVDTGVTLTINGPIEAGVYQIFSGLGTVTLNGRVGNPPVEWWGAVGDGTTDDSSPFQKAAASVPLKTQLTAEAEYILDNVIISRNVGLRGNGKGVLKHKAAAANHMIRYTAACSTKIEGFTIDGNKANQTIPTNFYACLYTYSHGQTISDCIFQNFVMAGILDYQTLTRFTVDNCVFLNGAEISDSLDVPYVNCGIQFTPGLVGGAPRVIVTRCEFEQAADPASGYRGPGGILLMGSDANSSYNEVQISKCRFKRVGWRSATNGAGIAALDIYADTRNLQLSDIIVDGTNFVGVKVQEAQNVQLNQVIVRNCTYTIAVDYAPGERSQEDEYDNAQFINLTVEDCASAIALYIRAGDQGGWHNVEISNFIARDVACGIRLNGLTLVDAEYEGYGPVQITNAQIWSNGTTSLAGLEIQNVAGVVMMDNSFIVTTGANGVRALTAGTNTSCRLKVRGCDITADSAAFYAIRIGGLAEATITDNTLSGAGAGGAAIQVRDDTSGNKLGRLIYHNNSIRAGAVDIDHDDITEIQLTNQLRVVGNQRTSVGSVNAVETDLWSIALQAGALYTNGDSLELWASGQTRASADTKRIRIYLGATQLYDSAAHALSSAACDWVLRMTITRVSATNHRHAITMQAAQTGWLTVFETSGAEDMSTALTLRITGTGTVTDDVQINGGKAVIVGLPLFA